VSFVNTPVVNEALTPQLPPDVTRNQMDVQGEALSEFLSRPLFIYQGTWTPNQGAAETATLDPWSLFLTNKRVINRINNYNLFRGNMKLRILMNGNGFYYGRLLLDYVPLATLRTCSGLDPTVAYNNIAASQRHHVYIDPSQSTVTDMELPFVYYYDAISIPANGWTDLGRLYIRQLAPLLHANGGVSPLTFTISAWIEDAELSVPTSIDSGAIVPQARIDYEKPGPVTRLASALSTGLSALSTVPGLSVWATPASMAVSAGASLARAFGWSRPLTLEPAIRVRPEYNPPFATTDAEDTSQKLTVDSKNTLTVDPSVVGYKPPNDELSIAHLCGIESYLTSFPWTAASTTGTVVWNARVTPMLGGSDGTNYYMTAAAFCAVPFTKWRGCVKFRFQVVCSAYHRGRLLVTWDPVYAGSIEPNIQLTRVVDITDNADFSVCIGWGQVAHFLTVDPYTSCATNYSTTAFGSASSSCNGVLTVSVLNELATPSSVVSDVSVLAFMSLEDPEFANPAPLPRLVDSYHVTPQALMEGTSANPDPVAEQPVITCHETDPVDGEMLVYYGESVPSFRALLKRYTLNHTVMYNNASASTIEESFMSQSDYPLYYGYGANTMYLTSGSKHVNFATNSLYQWLAPAFLAVRGSYRSKYVVKAPGASLVDVKVVREYTTAGTVTYPNACTSYTAGTTSLTAARGVLSTSAPHESMRGIAYTNNAKQALMEVECPFYRTARFSVGSYFDSSADVAPHSTCHGVLVSTAGTSVPITIERWTAAGEDFSLTWFLGPPPLANLALPAS